jgi:uncharacterized protein YyaL (SSP411 family)
MMEKFWDKEADGFFFTEKEELPFLGRFKQLYDQAIPSSNSVAVMNLVRLGYLDQNESWKKMVEDILRIFYPYLTRQAIGFSHLLSGFLFYLEPEEIKIMGPKEDPMIKDMIREIYLNFLPHKILSFQEAAEPAVIICRGFTCLPPIKDVQELSKILK